MGYALRSVAGAWKESGQQMIQRIYWEREWDKQHGAIF